MNSEFLAAVITGAILAGMPLLLAALGETISEQAGVLNIGLEGMMLFGAYGGFVVANWTGSSWLGFLGAMIAGMAVSLLMVVFCVYMGQDQIVVGIAILLSVEGSPASCTRCSSARAIRASALCRPSRSRA